MAWGSQHFPDSFLSRYTVPRQEEAHCPSMGDRVLMVMIPPLHADMRNMEP